MLQIQKAVKEQIDLRAAITGPTGGGKTYTALRLAFALAKDGKVLVIDTERKSARKYADEKPDGFPWQFDVLELPDFSPSTYTEAIKIGTRAGYEVIIIDSFSHAWEGEGGILELQQKYGGRYQDWAKVNPLHFGLIDTILTAPCHMIVTMRSKMDYALNTDDNGKVQVTKLGMAPIQRSGVQYEFDFILDMDWANNGKVDKTRCSAMRGKSAVMPGPEFFRPLIDWLGSGAETVRQHWSADEKKRLSLEKNVTKIGATIEDFFKVHDLADWEDFTRYEGEPADAWSYFKEQWQAKNGVKEGV